MNVLETINRISELAPAQLGDFSAPIMPDVSAAGELAAISGASAADIEAAAKLIDGNNHHIAEITAEAQVAITTTAENLLGIGHSFLQQAAPVALTALQPVPGAAAGAITQLDALARSHMAEAKTAANELDEQLSALATRLHGIAEEPFTLDDASPTATPPSPAQYASTGGNGTAYSPGNNAAFPEANFVPAALETTEETGAQAGTPTGTETENTTDDASAAAGRAAVAAARSQLGTPYQWGGTTPGVGFDCSGFTQWAWGEAGVDIPRLAHEQAVGQQVSVNELREGDLAVWDGHVAMYAGNGELIEAGSPVSTSPLRTNNLDMNFHGFYRPTA
ncbi:C40 family peptidase [Corynebacterium pseudodiphtheriticum]|uniref:C40 family peptidase n=1 Tax=Corynebacterium pseudodiphtheriticum TaxID=37637 RepID=UPI00254CDA8D|nr:C40 family peptidase [Corynebacterium pseudodiphtheriticum]MDK8685498.1 NlpC/P60 family protein [Corynebacterium pseudodiphtheriticum]